MCKRVDILYVTYLTSTAREAAVKETDTDKRRWCTLAKPERHPASSEAALHCLEACAKKQTPAKHSGWKSALAVLLHFLLTVIKPQSESFINSPGKFGLERCSIQSSRLYRVHGPDMQVGKNVGNGKSFVKKRR